LGGVTVPHLLLIDATLGAVAIMVAAWIVIWRWWSERRSQRYAEAAGLASEGAALGEMTVVPGFSEGAAEPDPGARGPEPGARGPDPGLPEPDPGRPEPDPDLYPTDPGAREPAGLDQAPPQVSGVADADSGADDPEPGVPEPEPGASGPARPEQAPAQLNGVAGAGPGAHAPAAEPGGPQGADSTVTGNGRVSSYYEGADQPMADYLAELGWSEESESGARDWG